MRTRFIFYCTFTSLLFLNSINTYSQEKLKLNEEVRNFYIGKFQDTVDELQKSGYYNPDREIFNEENILSSEEMAMTFAQNILLQQHPKCSKEDYKQFFVAEDKSSKIWFIVFRLQKQTLDGEIYMMVLKSNCKILFLSRHI